jgi:predicted O-linked N-acetylglucosamine transferase (SPINDLY family)
MTQYYHARVIGLAIALVSLIGCSVIPEQQPCQCPPAVEPVVMGQMDDMMQYYESLRKLPAPDLAKLHERVKQNFMQNKSDANRLRLVLLLTLPQTSFRDIQGAINLLNEWPRDAKPNNLQSFRNLLASFLADQQRLSTHVEEASQKLKEEQKRADMLQHQIDALKSMEKNLILIQP